MVQQYVTNMQSNDTEHRRRKQDIWKLQESISHFFANFHFKRSVKSALFPQARYV